MPTFRPDLQSIRSHRPGGVVGGIARDLGISDLVRLAANEFPEAPFPEVQQAIAAAAAGANRYPDNAGRDLVRALARKHAISPDHIWLGAGSAQLLGCIALAVGGPGTSAIYAQPSFALYPVITAIGGTVPIEVPCDDLLRHDLDAMTKAVRDDTTVVYVCNPNNPTGTHVPAAALDAFIARVPRRVLIVVDEAYGEFVTAPDYSSALSQALERDNLVVTRTFSKAYGLAGLRVGYAVGQPTTLRMLATVQLPFSVGSVSQAGALSALAHDGRLAERVAANAAGRDQLEAAFAGRGLEFASSQANFVLFAPETDPGDLTEAMLQEGVLVRVMGSWVRVSVGTTSENERFIAALDAATAALRT